MAHTPPIFPPHQHNSTSILYTPPSYTYTTFYTLSSFIHDGPHQASSAQVAQHHRSTSSRHRGLLRKACPGQEHARPSPCTRVLLAAGGDAYPRWFCKLLSPQLKRKQTLTSTPLQTGQIIEEAQKSPQTREIDEVNRMVAARLANKATPVEEALLRLLFDRETKIEQEKLEQAAATEAKKQQWVLDGQRRHQGILSADRDLPWKNRHLNRAFLGYGDRSDSDEDSVLTEFEGDIATLNPDRIPEEGSVVGKQPAVGDTSTPTPEVVEEEVSPSIPSHIPSVLTSARPRPRSPTPSQPSRSRRDQTAPYGSATSKSRSHTPL